MLKKLIFPITLTAILLSGLSCVTHKKKGEVSGFKKFYHNTTAHYNGYFNARELMYYANETIEASAVDNYGQILPVYRFGSLESTDAIKADMDKAIDKVGTVVSLHRVSRWTDDCYLLLGQAQYMKRDFESAENSLAYFKEEFDPLKTELKKKSSKVKKKKKKKVSKKKKKRKIKKKKKRRKSKKRKLTKSQRKRKAAKAKKQKEKEKREAQKKKEEEEKRKKEEEENYALGANQQSVKNSKGGWFKHEPCYWEGFLWLAKTYTERTNYFQAEYHFKELVRNPAVPERLYGDIHASYADLFLRQKKYDKAVPYLKNAVEYTKKKKQRSRYQFILGQIYSKLNKPSKSNGAYAACLKLKPEYDMVFHAKIGQIQNNLALGDAANQASFAKLKSMLRDKKNEEYKSEIHYLFAQSYLKQNKTEKALESFQNCIRTAQGKSNFTKAESYWTLANLYLDKQDYQKAKYYYDSTLMTIAKNDDRRNQASLMSANLNDIASQLEIIQKNDELIRISNLSNSEKRELALKRKSESMAKKEAMQAVVLEKTRNALRNMDGATPLSNPRNSKEQESSFFAYHIRDVNRGRSEFKHKWGERQLEDHWRRKDKTGFGSFASIEDSGTPNEEDEELEDDLLSFLPGVPENDAQRNKLKNETQNALFKLGVAYRNRIENYRKSNETFEDLLKRNAQYERKPDVYYYQYLNYLDLGESGRAISFKDALAREYPETKFARILNDEEYARQLAQKPDPDGDSYNAAYLAFEHGDYQKSLDQSQALSKRLKKPNPLLPKAVLLQSMALGQINGKDAYITALRDLVAQYPNTPEERHAREILRLFKGDNEAFIKITDKSKETRFIAEDDKMHFMALAFYDKENLPLKKINISVSDFNTKHFPKKKLKFTTIELENEESGQMTTVLIVRSYKNRNEAMDYYKKAKLEGKDFIPQTEDYDIFPITQNNYRQILRTNSFSDYHDFFNAHYLGK